MSRRFLAWFVAGLLVLAGLRWLDLHPIPIGTIGDDIERRPPPPASDTGRSDVLVLFDARRIARHGGDPDRSLAWLSLLQAEIGPVDRLDLSSSPQKPLATGHRAYVVTRSAHASIDERLSGALEAAVRAGAVCLLDDAGALEGSSPLRRLAGLAPDEPAEAAPSGPPLLPFLGPDLNAAFASTAPGPTVRRPLRPDAANRRSDAPWVLERNLGAGTVRSLEVSVAEWYSRCIQGAPLADRPLGERLGDYPGLLEPDDLLGDPQLRACEVPFADLLARQVARLLDPAAGPPLPRLAWFPPGSQGVYLLTSDEDFAGPAACRLLVERAAAGGLRPTLLILADPRVEERWSAADVAALARAGAAFGIHWDRFRRPFGLPPVEPLLALRPLADQIARLRSLGVEDPLVNRNHFLVWGPTAALPFRVLEAAGVALDLTFGTNKGRGFAFGTARPFHPLDASGFPFALLELPFHHQENWGGADPAFLRRLLEENARRYHGAVQSLLHPPGIVAGSRTLEWVDLLAETAQRTGHVSLTASSWNDWWRARERAVLRSRPLPGDVLEIDVSCAASVALLWPPGPRPVLDAPERAVGRFESIRVDDDDWWVLELPEGTGRWRVRFEP